MSWSSLDSLVATLQRSSSLSLSEMLGGIRVEKHPSLPCHKDATLILPTSEGVKREFWLSDDGEVWGFCEFVNSTSKIYLSEKMFELLKTANIDLMDAE